MQGHQNTTITKRHDKLRYSSICDIGSKIGWVSMKEVYELYIQRDIGKLTYSRAGRPGSSEVPRNPLTRWDVSSIPANGIFLTKNLKT